MAVRQTVLTVAVLAFLAWAAVEARHVGEGPGRPESPRAEDRVAIEAAFGPVLRAQNEGRRDEALLALRERETRGPYRGYAAFLLGELAFEEGAYGPAVARYRNAVELEPSVADRDSAFSSARRISQRLDALARGPWKEHPPAEMRDLRYLQRRLAGGCE